MDLGLSCPVAVIVQVRGGDRRVYRLASEIGPHGIRLESNAPFEPGRVVLLSFFLPGNEQELATRAMVEKADDGEGNPGTPVLRFKDSPQPVTDAIQRYVADRLELPFFPS